MYTIATHDGQFHADEAFACALLRRTAKYCGSKIIRSRNEEILAKADIVVDVGMVYDPERQLFDHHQPTFCDTYSPLHKTLLSSAGLIYKHFGKEIIENQINIPHTSEDVDSLYLSIYESFVESFDANDNGISAYPSSTPAPAFSQGPTIFSQVRWLNPRWNLSPEERTDEMVMQRFERAISLIDLAFGLCLESKILGSFPGKSLLKKYMIGRKYSKILLLDEYIPWTEHLHCIEEEEGEGEDSKCIFAVFPDAKRGWRIQAVPKYAPGSGMGSFENRKSLPLPWRGTRDDEMDSVTSIKGGIFVHRAGFIGGHLDRDGAIALALKAIQYEEEL